MSVKVVLICGGAAVGKTGVVRRLTHFLKESNKSASLCKIDCLHTDDDKIYTKTGFPYVIGLSGDICPDHFLVSNLEELIHWSNKNNTPYLIVETAGLCNRCSPATAQTISICVADGTASLRSPEKLGPMLTTADIVIISKSDMVSQAEREIIRYKISEINNNAMIFQVDTISGFGYRLLFTYLESLKTPENMENDLLRHTTPSAVCSYCIGEKRIGSKFQQGIVEKIQF